MGFSELSYCANITFLRHFYIVGSAFSSTFFEWLYRVSTCGIDREIEWFVVFSAFWVFLGATRIKFTCPNYYGIGCNSTQVLTSQMPFHFISVTAGNLFRLIKIIYTVYG